MTIPRRTVSWAVLVGACLLMLGIWSCGRKGPPVPPQRPPLPRPAGLTADRSADTVQLRWRAGTPRDGVTAYAVLRAQWPAGQPPCDGCPLIYQEVGRVPAAPGSDLLTYTDRIRSDYGYRYKVRALGSAGDRSPDSNTVLIVPEQAPDGQGTAPAADR